MRGSRTIRTAENEMKFLDALSLSANVTQACEVSGVARRSVYDWREEDETFKEKWEEAFQKGLNALEDEAIRRGREGFLEDVYYKGEVCGKVRKFSDTLLMFSLKANRREKFGDSSNVNLTGGLNFDTLVKAIADKRAKGEE